jgi:hypothetical protein
MAMSLSRKQKVSVNAILPGWIHTGDPETVFAKSTTASIHPDGSACLKILPGPACIWAIRLTGSLPDSSW